ncbi:MAG: hypothetical protein CMJ46_14845 [Planctomyces sp.]|nr:hypothetical protein [Planctomyces sp.]
MAIQHRLRCATDSLRLANRGTPEDTEDEAFMNLSKITAFVVRPNSGGVDVLTFRHPTAGRQFPAGTVEQGEGEIAAAIREVREETGYVVRGEARRIETLIEQLPTGHAVIAWTSPEADIDPALRRGIPVRLRQVRGEEALVVREEFDFGVEPPPLINEVEAWMPTQSLATTIARHFLLFVEPAAASGEREAPYRHSADGHVFEVAWLPLSPELVFAGHQQQWRETLRAALRVEEGGTPTC